MAKFSASEARARFNEVLELAKTEAVEIQKHGKSAVVILDAMKYEKFLDYVEDLEDSLTILEHQLNPGDPSTYTSLDDLVFERELGDEQEPEASKG
jgi:prevent-host-death family protein